MNLLWFRWLIEVLTLFNQEKMQMSTDFSTMEVMFTPMSIYLLICLFVNEFTQKQLDVFPQNLVEGCGMCQGRTH